MANRVLVVVDMQNDFITGALANKEGQAIVKDIAELVRVFDGDIIATRDTHLEDYLGTLEGKKLPVPHCVRGTNGWQIVPEIQEALDAREKDKTDDAVEYIDKYTFGSTSLGAKVARRLYDEAVIVGVCTDICVISNAFIIKAFAPETKVTVLPPYCAGVTPESHKTALKAMKACQIDLFEG